MVKDREGVMRRVLVGLVAVVMMAVAPVAARADRGALSLDFGVGLLPASLSPPAGTGANQTGVSYGGSVGVRYALTNRLEFTGSGFFDAPVPWNFADNAMAPSGGTPLVGVLSTSMGAWGLGVGARYCVGVQLRACAGGEVGLASVSYSSVSHEIVGSLPSQSTTGFQATLGGGLEWLLTDHQTVGIMPRLRVVPGSGTWVYLPIVYSYSWYFL